MFSELAACKYTDHRPQFVKIGCLEQTPEALEHIVSFPFTLTC